jgi:hypothetical protein
MPSDGPSRITDDLGSSPLRPFRSNSARQLLPLQGQNVLNKSSEEVIPTGVLSESRTIRALGSPVVRNMPIGFGPGNMRSEISGTEWISLMQIFITVYLNSADRLCVPYFPQTNLDA